MNIDSGNRLEDFRPMIEATARRGSFVQATANENAMQERDKTKYWVVNRMQSMLYLISIDVGFQMR